MKQEVAQINQRVPGGPKKQEVTQMDFESLEGVEWQEASYRPETIKMPKPEAMKASIEPVIAQRDVPCPATFHAMEVETLPPEWQELFGQFVEAHLQMLSSLLHGRGAAERDKIAERVGSMPELLLDEINELSMEWIGDLLIDGDEIAEQYRTELLELFAGMDGISAPFNMT
jgi:hypothetical protein